MTNRSVIDDGTLCCGCRSVEYFGAADSRWIFVLKSYFYLLYCKYIWLDQHTV